LSGCGAVYSSRNIQSVTDVSSIVYSVPTTLLAIEVREVEERAFPIRREGEIELIVTGIVLPDTNHTYSLDRNGSAFASDEVTITVDHLGLLTTVDTRVEDKTDDIVIALAKSVSGIATYGIPGVSSSKDIAGEDKRDFGCLKGQPLPTKIIVDPTDKTTWPEWIRGCLDVRAISEQSTRTIAARGPESCERGICHRVPLPYIVTLDFGDVLYAQELEYFLNESPVVSYDVSRSPLVEKVEDLTFRDGILTSATISEPSTALEVANLPLNVVKALLSAPAEILRLRVDYNSEVENAYATDVRALEAENAYREFLQEQQDRKKAETLPRQFGE